VPWIAWVRRLRPDPLRRLGLERAQLQDARTSLPPPTPVERAKLDSAIRSLAHDTSAGLPDPWPALARRAATANEAVLADRLDQAMAGADLRMTRPRWWSVARWVQRALTVVAAVGALWLLALAGLGYLQLNEVVPTPDVEGIPAPTGLLVGGILAGLLLAFLARLANRSGARRRARRARRAMHERVVGVADELVIAPLEAELATHGELTKALEGERRRGSPRVPVLSR
jgi:hypothetical protein